MHPQDQTRVAIASSNKHSTSATPHVKWVPGLVPGLEVMPLHAYETEHVALVKWAPGTTFQRHQHWGGEEIFVLDGVFEDDQGVYPKGTWLRNPPNSVHTPFSRSGCIIYVKTGHLESTPQLP